MAYRTWGRPLLTALGVSLLAGAGQLGVAFGFGIVRLTGTFTGATVNQWPAQLVWAGWFAANAAVVGAVLTERLARRDGLPASTGRHLAVAGAAALGATVVAPLCMQPARAAELVSVDPVWAVGICALLGALAGAGAAVAVLLHPPVGWNLAAVAGVVWLLALLSVAPSLASTGQLPTVRLGVLEPTWLDAGAAQRLALVILPLVALLAGAATGGSARWRGHPPLVSGATGVAGPVLVAFAYLTAGPGDTADRYQLTPYYAALLAVAAGALGSAAATLLRWPLVTRTAPTGAIEPTDILRPLPAGPALPQPAGADEPATVDLADAGLAATDRPAGAGSADDGSPRATPAHWDWPADGSTTSTTPATTDAARPTGSPATTDPARPTGPAATTARPGGSPARAEARAPGGRDDTLLRLDADVLPPATPDAAARPPATPDAAAQPSTTPDAGVRPPTTPDANSQPPATPDAGVRPSTTPQVGGRRPATPGRAEPATAPDAGGPSPGTPDGERPAATSQADEQPPAADEGAAPTGQPAGSPAPKPRRARKTRATRQPATASTDSTDPVPTAGSPTADRDLHGETPTAAEPSAATASPAADTPVPTHSPAATDTPVTAHSAAAVPPADAGFAATGDSYGSPETDGVGPRPAPLFPVGGATPGEPSATLRPAWRPASAWPTTPRVGPDTAADTTGPADAEPTPDPAPRPRHLAPMPDLARAANWDALATARRGGPAPAPVDAALGNGTAATEAPDVPVEREAAAGASDQSGGGIRARLGLFRRNRSRAEDAAAGQDPEPLPAQDEEYVDWVAGLGKPIADNEPDQESGRRSLRSTGRHHRD
ncbi:hypothetical protein GA0070606_4013 [Micromonospora citrea]|uniref:Uncharacterized protein n=1 Tax=Micromonospora citrea TaxID=47855 RepID=A0A1C6VE66_9ACTN|nr:hypothetical protein [Micromonospora citrea]SCL64653.1 hypothetical protein GA0070606_4013 [Micromonospora citrea]